MALTPFNPRRHRLDGPMTDYLITEYDPEGRVWTIPTVWFDEEGKRVELSHRRAVREAKNLEKLRGKQFPRFESLEDGKMWGTDLARAYDAKDTILATSEEGEGVDGPNAET